MNIAIIAGLIFASSYGLQLVFQQIFVRGIIHPVHLNFLSYSVAAIVLGSLMTVHNRKSLIIRSKKGWILGTLVAFSGSVFADLLVLFGLQFTSSVNWSLLSRLTIVVTFILAVIFFHERVMKSKIIAIFFALCGVVMVVYQKGSGIQMGIGNLFFIGAVLGMSINNTISQLALRYIKAQELSFIRIFTSAIMMGIITFVAFPMKQITVWPFIVLNGLFMILGISMINIVIKKQGAAFFTILSTTVPLFTAIFSALLLKSFPTTLQIAGGSLIIIGIFLFSTSKKIR